MSVCRDPDEKPSVPDGMFNHASKLGAKVIQVIIEDQEGDSVNFFTVVDHLPPIGSRITLENQAVCEVNGILFNAVRVSGFLHHVAVVAANYVGSCDSTK